MTTQSRISINCQSKERPVELEWCTLCRRYSCRLFQWSAEVPSICTAVKQIPHRYTIAWLDKPGLTINPISKATSVKGPVRSEYTLHPTGQSASCCVFPCKCVCTLSVRNGGVCSYVSLCVGGGGPHLALCHGCTPLSHPSQRAGPGRASPPQRWRLWHSRPPPHQRGTLREQRLGNP